MVVSISVPQKKAGPLVVDRDEHPRADSSLDALARLKPAFKIDGGTVTADELARVTASNLDPEFGRVLTAADAIAALER